MSRFVRESGETFTSSTSGLTSSDVCCILCTYQGTLSAANACLVCNLRTEYEIICYCQCWTTCYGSSLIFSLPTTEYYEFKLGFFGQYNSSADTTCIHFGNDTVIPCNFCQYSGNTFSYPQGLCVISCLASPCSAAYFQTSATCNQSSFVFNLKKTWSISSCGAYFCCPVITYDACFWGNCCATQTQFYGTTLSGGCFYWRDVAASDTFTRLRISNTTGIRSCNGYWYILGKKNRILDI